jgi:molybdenum cofactor cytidylyltransferase
MPSARSGWPEVGITERDVRARSGPVGLNIGAKSPAEIAVSILGQIIEVRARRPRIARRAEGRGCVKFGETPIDEATGAILAHSWRANGINFAKGRVLSQDDVFKLKMAGAASVVAARLDPEDMHEDEAAATVARALAGKGIEVTAAFTGRCNHFASEAGLAVIDHERIDALNELDESVTVATLAPFARVTSRMMVATVKVIPYAAPRTAVSRAVDVAKSANQPLVSIAPFRPMRAGLVQTRLPGTRDKVLDKAVGTTGKRLTSLGGSLAGERRCGHDAASIAAALNELKAEGCDLYLIAGASAIVDRHDVVPAGIEQAGGKVTHFGMPVDPGNLLLTGELDGKPVLGLPGCAKSPKYNGFDMVLERLAAGLPVGAPRSCAWALADCWRDSDAPAAA